MKVKLIDFKLLGLGIIFIVVVLYMTITSIGLIDDNTAEFISNMQGEDVYVNLMSNVSILKDTASSLAADTDIVNTLQRISNYGYRIGDEEILQDNINNFLYIMSNLSFVQSIGIISIPGEFIVSDSVLVKNYRMSDRPWFDEDLYTPNHAYLTDIYTNLLEEKYTCSVVKFIYDQYTGNQIGAVLVNIFIEDLIAYIIEDYRIADVDVYVEHSTGTIMSLGGNIIRTDETSIDVYSIYSDRNVNVLEYPIDENDINITLVIDLVSIKANEYVAENSTFVIHRIVALAFCITAIILITATIILRPVVLAIQSLIHIIEELGDEYPEYVTGFSEVDKMAKFIEENLPKKIRYLIYYDELTGLPNRKMFKSEFRAFTSTTIPFVVMLLDIKNFKGINDTCGDDVGDIVLIDIGSRLTRAMEKVGGTVIRYSGDEFIIMVKSANVRDDIEYFYEEEILPLFSEPLAYPDKKPIPIEFNAAAIISPLHCYTEEDMITKIYVMLRKCKEINTNSLLLFNNDVYSVYVNEEKIKSSLKGAIETEEFVINYQPIIDPDKNIRKAEALIRWFSKDLGFVPPNEFIYVAEQTRMIIDLGNWIIERVAKDLKTLFDEGRPVQISINISPIQIMEEDFVQNATAILDRYNIDYSYVCFEITESILIEERGVVKQNIKALQEVGIHLALDDFGTGYSSFSYLKEYSLDIIKIDKVFVDNATEKDYAIIDGIKRISNALGMQMILEGIETQEQFDELNKFGLIQGYYFSRPIVWKDFVELLDEKGA